MAEAQRKRGRPKGSLNKATADIRALAQVYTPRALKVLSSIMEQSESDPARVSAAKELLERGHGRSPMAEEDRETIGGSLEVLARAWARTRAA